MQRVAIGALALASVAILLAVLIGGAVGERVFVAASLTVPGALIALSGRPAARPWRALVPGALTLWLELAAALVLFGAGPVPALAMLVGFGLMPLVVVPWVFARSERRSS